MDCQVARLSLLDTFYMLFVIDFSQKLRAEYSVYGVCRQQVDKKTVLENLDLVLLAIDEILDAGYVTAAGDSCSWITQQHDMTYSMQQEWACINYASEKKRDSCIHNWLVRMLSNNILVALHSICMSI